MKLDTIRIWTETHTHTQTEETIAYNALHMHTYMYIHVLIHKYIHVLMHQRTIISLMCVVCQSEGSTNVPFLVLFQNLDVHVLLAVLSIYSHVYASP